MKKILSRILPLEKVIGLAARFGLLAKPLALLAGGWSKAQGYRTQILIAASSALAVGAALGFYPWEAVDTTINTLLGLAGGSFLDKWNRVAPTVKKVSGQVADEASKPQP